MPGRSEPKLAPCTGNLQQISRVGDVPPSDGGTVLVPLVCGIDASGTGLPLHLSPRKIPAPASGQMLLEAAVVAWLDGASGTDAAGGLTTALGQNAERFVRGVTLQNDAAIIDFSTAFGALPNVSASGVRIRLLTQASAAARQVPSVRSVTFSLEGSCQAFATALEILDCGGVQ